MKKNILFVGALAILLVSCGNNSTDTIVNENKNKNSAVAVNKSDFPIVDEKLDMTMIAPGLGLNEWNDMDFMKDYEQKTNIHMDVTTPPQSEFKTKLNLAFASGDIPDVIYAGGPNTLNAAAEVEYGSQGLLTPLEDLIPEYAPNFNKLMQ